MNIELADYGLVIEFGTREDFDTKLRMNNETFDDVVNYTDIHGISLLSRCLGSRKFDLAKEFLDRGATVNRISKEGYSELHILAANINLPGGVEVARMLLERGASLMAKDKKYGNSALFTLCYEVFKVRSDESLKFLEDCFRQVQPSDFDICNKRGYSIRQVINERGTEELKRIMEERS